VNFTGAVGAYARFEIAVIGTVKSYQWQYSDDGANWTNSTVTAAFYTTMVTKGRAGRQVRCIVTDVFGDALTSNAATIGVLADVAVSGSYNDLSDKPSVDGATNANAHLRSFGNSIMTGSVWKNGAFHHLSVDIMMKHIPVRIRIRHDAAHLGVLGCRVHFFSRFHLRRRHRLYLCRRLRIQRCACFRCLCLLRGQLFRAGFNLCRSLRVHGNPRFS
jgi:hypothetical protein